MSDPAPIRPAKRKPPGFFKTTLLGALLVVVPAGIVGFALWQVARLALTVFKPVFDLLPFDSGWLRAAAIAASLLATLLVCYAVGLAVRTRWGAKLRRWAERRFLEKIPGYSTVRSLAHQYIGHDDERRFRPVLVALYSGETQVIAFEIEALPDGRVAVFVPSSPAVTLGAVHIVPPDRVHPVDATMHATIEAVAMFGEGAGKLVAPPNKGRAPDGQTRSGYSVS